MARSIFLFLISFSVVCSADSNALLQKGLDQYHNGEYEEAKALFQELLKAYPQSPSVLLNLGLTQYQLGEHGMAIGLWRQALEYDPTFNKAIQAIAFVQKQLPVTQLPHQVLWTEKLRQSFLRYISWDWCLFLLALCGFFFAFLGIRYFVVRHKHSQKGWPAPALPVMMITSGVVFLLVVSLVVLKIKDYWTPRATIVSIEVPAKSGPSEDMASLFDLFEGLDVILKQVHQDWVQVSYPGGQTGWVQKKDLFHYAGRRLW